MTDLLLTLAFFLIVVALVFVLLRLFRGPQAVDRIVCLDLLGIAVGALICIHSVQSGHEEFIDVVLVISIIVFFSTIVFARYIEGYIEGRSDRWQ